MWFYENILRNLFLDIYNILQNILPQELGKGQISLMELHLNVSCPISVI